MSATVSPVEARMGKLEAYSPQRFDALGGEAQRLRLRMQGSEFVVGRGGIGAVVDQANFQPGMRRQQRFFVVIEQSHDHDAERGELIRQPGDGADDRQLRAGWCRHEPLALFDGQRVQRRPGKIRTAGRDHLGAIEHRAGFHGVVFPEPGEHAGEIAAVRGREQAAQGRPFGQHARARQRVLRHARDFAA
jgi:hypothetical protein